jgi:hypothetical protein
MPTLTILLIVGALVGALILGVLLTIGILYALGLLSSNATKEGSTASSAPAKTSEASTTTQAKSTARPKTVPTITIGTAQEGEPADMEDRTVTLNGSQRNFVFPNNSPKPETGNEFILMNITITNKSSQPLRINMGHFEAEDSNGVRRPARYTPQLPDPIPNVGSVAPGGEVTGNLAVEAPQGDPNVKLVYRPQ